MSISFSLGGVACSLGFSDPRPEKINRNPQASNSETNQGMARVAEDYRCKEYCANKYEDRRRDRITPGAVWTGHVRAGSAEDEYTGSGGNVEQPERACPHGYNGFPGS